MIEEVLDLPPAMAYGINGTLARMFFEEGKRLRAGTYCWDFVKKLFEDNSEEKEWKKYYNSLFAVSFTTEDECQQHIIKKIEPNIKSTNWEFLIDNNKDYWRYDFIKPAKFRNYAKHKDVWCPVIHVKNNKNKTAVWASCAAFDSYDPYEAFDIFENFRGILKEGKAISGEAIYQSVINEWKKKVNTTFPAKNKITFGNYSTRYNPNSAVEVNAEIEKAISEIPNKNVLGIHDNDLKEFNSELHAFRNEHIYGFIKGSEFKKLFMELGVDKHTKYTIEPNASLFTNINLTQRNPENTCSLNNPDGHYAPDILYAPETICKRYKDNEIYPLVFVGWTRYSVPFIPDGECKKRWQSQFKFWDPDEKLKSEDWCIESLAGFKAIDEVLYRAKKDSACQFIPEPMTAEEWKKVYEKYDEVSLKRTWDISREEWAKETAVI